MPGSFFSFPVASLSEQPCPNLLFSWGGGTEPSSCPYCIDEFQHSNSWLKKSCAAMHSQSQPKPQWMLFATKRVPAARSHHVWPSCRLQSAKANEGQRLVRKTCLQPVVYTRESKHAIPKCHPEHGCCQSRNLLHLSKMLARGSLLVENRPANPPAYKRR